MEDLILETRDRDARVPDGGSAWVKIGRIMLHLSDYGTGITVTAYRIQIDERLQLEVAGESVATWSIPDGRPDSDDA